MNRNEALPVKKQSGPHTGRKTAAAILINLVVIIYSITCIFPVVWMAYSSLKTTKDFESNVIGLPTSLHFENYATILSGSDLPLYMLNTIRNTAISLFFIILFGFINGFIISRYRFRGRKVLFTTYMLGMLVPVHALLVPMYILFSRLNLTDAWFTVSLPNIAFGIPTALFLVEGYVSTVPVDIDEAAAIDGASFSRTMFTIIGPIAAPILITVGIITFFSCWNEFSFSLVLLKSPKLYTVPLGLTLFKGTYRNDYPRMMTTMFLAMVPALIIYIAFSKQIINGMMAGAIKG